MCRKKLAQLQLLLMGQKITYKGWKKAIFCPIWAFSTNVLKLKILTQVQLYQTPKKLSKNQFLANFLKLFLIDKQMQKAVTNSLLFAHLSKKKDASNNLANRAIMGSPKMSSTFTWEWKLDIIDEQYIWWWVEWLYNQNFPFQTSSFSLIQTLYV